MKLITSLFLLAFGATAIHAEVPRVVTSIAPVQGLVADIMAGVGTPELLLSEAISPHDFAMRPSQARAIGDADVIFYVGQHMEPWLEKALQSREQNELVVALGDMPSLHRLEARELNDFGAAHDEHNHDQVFDPHMWLDPENALLWLDVIAGVLEIADPENEALYRRNLEQSRAEIVAANISLQSDFGALEGIEMIVTHDSLQYLEAAFGLKVIGAFTASDGQASGARNMSELLQHLDSNTCIVEDLTHPSRIAASLPEDVNHVVVDPMGYAAVGQTGYYSKMLSDIAQSLMKCRD